MKLTASFFGGKGGNMHASRWLAALLLSAAPRVVAADDCAGLLRLDFSSLADAPAQLTLAGSVDAAGIVPAYCRVQGYVRPRVRFELRLPRESWNGKLLMEGCGGFCGSLDFASRCDARLARSYACIVSDMGHVSTPFDGKWAWNDREAEIDFGYRATHVTAVAGKAIATAFYARPPARSYFHGCSTGGRQGLVSAQRFPADFDGIVAGAPVLRMPASGMVLAWAMRAMHDATGRRIVTSRELELLHRAVLERCDARDGLADGIVGDPLSCDVDPGRVAGLDEPQVTALRKVYDGPRDSRGRPLFPSGLPRGSELGWIGTLVNRDEGPPPFYGFIAELFRYLSFAEDPGPAFGLEDFDFDRDPPRLGAMAQIFSGANPDLTDFRARGGKLLLYHGLADPVVVPQPSIDYYELATRAMGGPAATRDFFRLFLVPGKDHCTGGVGAYEIDYLGALERWVERGEAPDVLVGTRPASATQPPLRRPIFAYPAQAAYRGRGDPNDTASFMPLLPPIVAGGLRAITLTTADAAAMRRFLVDGVGLRELPASAADGTRSEATDEIWFERAGDPVAPRVRVRIVGDAGPRLRETPSATRDGGASLSFALQRGRAQGPRGALARLAAAGYQPIGQFTVPLARPGGGQYTIEEYYFVGPDNLLVPVVVRPDDMPPIARIDTASGLGGPAYGGMTVPDADAEIAFHRSVLGLELRRDIELTEPSLLRAAGLPAEARVRFVQLFAPGTASGNLTLIDLGAKGERNPAPLAAPSRGAVLWSFAVGDIEEARRRVRASQGRLITGPDARVNAVWGAYRALIVESPGGLRFELVQPDAP
jgi:feruloyl esterase